MEPPCKKEGLSVGLAVGMSGGGEGMFGGRLGLLIVIRTPSGIPWTSWLEEECSTRRKHKIKKRRRRRKRKTSHTLPIHAQHLDI